MKKLSLAIIAVAVFAACKKAEPPTPTPVKEVLLDATIKDYLHFKPGSYWVYKDSISQGIDSVVIVKSFNGFEDYTTKDTIFKYEAAGHSVHHSFNNQVTFFDLKGYYSFATHMWRGYYTTPFAVPLGTAAIRDADGRVIAMPGEKPVSVNGFNFTKGIETDWITYDKPSSGPFNQNKITRSKFMFARNVGVIKQVLKNDTLHQVWELIGYKVVQ